MTKTYRIAGISGGALIALGGAVPAWAHHAMDGAMPSTFGQGLISGLAHPIIGFDHFAFVLAAGILAAGLRGWALLPAAFVAAGLGGSTLHLAGADLPGAELLIAVSVLALGVLLVAGRQLPLSATIALFAAAGLVHGYALTESIVGAEPTPLGAYLTGFSVIQYAIALGASWATRRFVLPSTGILRLAPRAAGFAALAVGIVALGGNLIA